MDAAYTQLGSALKGPPNPNRNTSASIDDYDKESALYFCSSLMVALPQHQPSGSTARVASQRLVYDKPKDDVDTTTTSSSATSATAELDITSNKRALEPEEEKALDILRKWDAKAVYSKLRLDHSSIRIVEIQPGISSEEIHVSLDVYRLEAIAMQYEALSYVWGDQKSARDIYVNKIKVPIGPNLYSALESFRQPDGVKRIWIDAICINQTSFAEKSREVIKMGKIYSLASRVNVYLGAAAPNVSSPIDGLFRFLNRDDEKRTSNGDASGGLDSLQVICDLCHVDAYEVCKGFVGMCSQPWWGRVWILVSNSLLLSSPGAFDWVRIICLSVV
jgi:hypothetical protein